MVASLAPSVPTFGVRFETPDDFLVEYADHLQHGVVILPLRQPLLAGTAVRLRIRLPDETSLYVTGRALEAESATTRIKLDPLDESQRAGLQGCVAELVGQGNNETDAGEGDDLPAEARISVLLVDDSVTQRLDLGDALRARGLRVRVAENGLAALSMALKRPPDIILTDVEMPQMDGWALLRAVRKRKRLLGVPVVFLTRPSDDVSRLRGYRMGVDDFLYKLTAPDEIVAHLRGALARRRQLPLAMDPGRSLRGNLEHVRLGSLLAFLETERRSGVLTLESGDDHATLRLRHGELEHTESLERTFELLDWRTGHFEFFASEAQSAVPSPSSTPLSFVLMEHARRVDEATGC